MNTAVANSSFPDAEEFSLRKFLVYSGALHAAVIVAIAISAYLNFRGNQWAGAGGATGESVRVELVSSAGLPMPKPEAVTESTVVDPTKSLYKEEPPKPPEPPTNATKLPKFEKEKPLPPSHPSKVFENKTPPPSNAIPGHGGTPNIPSGYSGKPGSAAAGVSVAGQGGGDLASRYGWYIAAARRRVNPNWSLSSIDPGVRNSQTIHCAVSFTITRDGTVKNARVVEFSGNTSWDNAGLRAILNSSPLPALPSDYPNSEVSVTWDFPERNNR